MPAPILPGAEPASFPGGPDGVLVLHGFTGSPQSMRGLAEAIAAAGYAVELPLLPGHGTAVEDMIPTRWTDWSAAAEAAYAQLAARCRRVAVAGLSMGGTLAVWLAARHPEIAALVAINPALEEPAGFVPALRDLLAAGTETMPGIGSDIAKPGLTELAYPESPVAPLLSMLEQAAEIQGMLPAVACPVLVFTSTLDHVVPPSSSDLLAQRVTGPVHRVRLERSYHVATLDFDAPDVETGTVEFLAKVLGG